MILISSYNLPNNPWGWYYCHYYCHYCYDSYYYFIKKKLRFRALGLKLEELKSAEVCRIADFWAPPSEFLIQQVWGKAWESVLVPSPWMMLMLSAQSHMLVLSQEKAVIAKLISFWVVCLEIAIHLPTGIMLNIRQISSCTARDIPLSLEQCLAQGAGVAGILKKVHIGSWKPDSKYK